MSYIQLVVRIVLNVVVMDCIGMLENEALVVVLYYWTEVRYVSCCRILGPLLTISSHQALSQSLFTHHRSSAVHSNILRFILQLFAGIHSFTILTLTSLPQPNCSIRSIAHPLSTRHDSRQCVIRG